MLHNSPPSINTKKGVNAKCRMIWFLVLSLAHDLLQSQLRTLTGHIFQATHWPDSSFFWP